MSVCQITVAGLQLPESVVLVQYVSSKMALFVFFILICILCRFLFTFTTFCLPVVSYNDDIYT